MTPDIQSFHSLVDSSYRGYLTAAANGAWTPILPYITLRERSLTYQFFPHFHPYVGGSRAGLTNVPASELSLIRRLNDGGVDELQDADTVYMPQPNSAATPQPLNVSPNSTRATLTATVTGTRPDGATTLQLAAGTALTLPDSTAVTIPKLTPVTALDGTMTPLAAATPFSLPGQIPVTSASGIQFSANQILPDSSVVTLQLQANQYAVLGSDGSQVSLPAGTAVAIRSGIPLPLFFETIFNTTHYNPDPGNVTQPHPVKELDFSTSGAYSIYNWEIFFHAPLLIAIHLSQNQQYQDAQNWFHYIFNPTDNSLGPTPERFWKVKPFQYTDVEMIEQILLNLSTGQDAKLRQETIQSINDWMQNPFQPWDVAKYRPTAYMLKTVMAYLDNLIAWGDSLFQQYTIETINEASQLYILAANILGDKPQAVPVKGSVQSPTYNSLRANGGLDAFGNALVDMEVDMPFDIVQPSGSGTAPNGTQILANIGKTLAFCIPRNDRLLAYWDTVADRLFKIHNSLNLQGIFQRLPLYDPPIDPALLVRATAAGLDVSAVVGGLNQPLPLVRFSLLMAKATEICQEVKALGSGLLGAIEKQDNESLALLRSQHESAVLQLAEMVKYAQWQDAQKATQALQLTLATAVQRYSYYQKLLGRTDAQIQSSIPSLDALDLGGLQNLNFAQTDTSSEPLMALDPITPDIASASASVSDGEVKSLSNNEVDELNKLESARDAQLAANSASALGSVLAIIPQFKVHAQPMGCGATIDFGGQHLASLSQALASVARAVGDEFSYEAGKSGKIGSYSRRELEWTFQSNTARSDINQIQKQIRGAQLREAIAQKDYTNHQAQMADAQEIVDFLKGNDIGNGFQVKETTTGFYAWMKRETKALYANAFQLAFEVAKKAERALQNELGDSSLSYIQYNYLDGTEGLLAGEKLLFDLKTMEMAYHDLNQREYELTKHVSLLQIDPLALVQLRATGACAFTLPEEAFDLDCPGHYFRRTQSVAVTIPCIAGTYTSVNCTLTLQKSSIRVTQDASGTYARHGSDDPRFSDYYGTAQSIVTSSAQSDSGLFDTNPRDERYLPFERTGISGSQWQLSLPADIPQLDFDTIVDVILHVRFTAREGGDTLRAAAVANLQNLINKAQTVGSVRLFSIRHEFPTQWAKFKNVAIRSATPTAELQLSLVPELYPFWAQGIVGPNSVKGIELFAQMTGTGAPTTINLNDKADQSGHADTLVKNSLLGNLLAGTLTKIPLPAAITDATHPPLTLYFDNNTMDDLWLALTWGRG
jgi:Tc toxin complex TcA C-terminal TcB-binding domain